MTQLTGQAEAALMRLYALAERTTDNFMHERIDRALDEIVRLNSTVPPGWQVRSAMANASKVIRNRHQTVVRHSLEALKIDLADGDGGEGVVIELREWLHHTPGVTSGQRNLLVLLAADHEAADLVELYHIPAPRMREQISRARRAARAAYHHDADTA